MKKAKKSVLSMPADAGIKWVKPVETNDPPSLPPPQLPPGWPPFPPSYPQPPWPTPPSPPAPKIITLFENLTLVPGSGNGVLPEIYVHGYRHVNLHVIATPPPQSGYDEGIQLLVDYSLTKISATNPIGRARAYYNHDTFFNPETDTRKQQHRLTMNWFTDFTTFGGTPTSGGTDLTYVVRVPVLAPYIGASAMNRSATRTITVTVKAYLTL